MINIREEAEEEVIEMKYLGIIIKTWKIEVDIEGEIEEGIEEVRMQEKDKYLIKINSTVKEDTMTLRSKK